MNKSASATDRPIPVAKRIRRVRPDDAQIRFRAYELSLQRNGHHGDSVEDWLRAERELIDQVPTLKTAARAPRRAPARKRMA